MFTLTLNEQQIKIIGAALQELPFRVSAPVIGVIDKQLSEQQKETAEVLDGNQNDADLE